MKKPLYGTKHIDEIILTYLKETDPLYAGGEGLTKKQHNK